MEFFLIIRKHTYGFFFLLMLFFNLGKQTSIKTGVYHIGIIIIDPSGVARCLRAAAPASGRQVAHRAAPCALQRLRGSEEGGGSRGRSATDPQSVHISQEAPTRRLPPTFQSSSGNKTSGAAAAAAGLAFLSGTHSHIYISQEVLFSRTFLSTHIYLRI